MLYKLIVGIMLCMIAFLPTLVMGKGFTTYGKWWHDPQTSKQLNLTSSEKKQLDSQYTISRKKLIDLKAELEKEQFTLETLLESETLDEKAVSEQRKKLETSRSRLSKARFDMILETRKILGNNRFQHLKNKMINDRSKPNQKR